MTPMTPRHFFDRWWIRSSVSLVSIACDLVCILTLGWKRPMWDMALTFHLPQY